MPLKHWSFLASNSTQLQLQAFYKSYLSSSNDYDVTKLNGFCDSSPVKAKIPLDTLNNICYLSLIIWLLGGLIRTENEIINTNLWWVLISLPSYLTQIFCPDLKISRALWNILSHKPSTHTFWPFASESLYRTCKHPATCHTTHLQKNLCRSYKVSCECALMCFDLLYNVICKTYSWTCILLRMGPVYILSDVCSEQ